MHKIYKHEKFILFGLLSIILLVSVFIFFTVQRLQDTAALNGSSYAAGPARPNICGKCDQAGGVEYCRTRFDGFYQELRSKELSRKRPRLNERTFLNGAFSRMDRDDPSTHQDEEMCGYCDLNPLRGKNRYGEHVLNQDDINVYGRMCIVATPTPTQAPQPTLQPLTSCSACSDMNILRQCIFNSQDPQCQGKDANADGTIDAGDLSWCPLYCPQGSCSACSDMDLLRQCIFNSQDPQCQGKDANADGTIDAGDLSWCPLSCSQQQTQQVTQTLQIQAGWNLLSLYVEPQNPSTVDIFGSFFTANNPYDGQNSTYTSAVWSYNSSTAYWIYYLGSTSAPQFLKNLKEIHVGQGLFIYSYIPYTISVTGTIPEAKIPALKEDTYNLVGITSSTPQPISSLIDRTTYPNATIWRFRNQGVSELGDQSNQFDKIVGPGIINNAEEQLEPGIAYWIHLTLPPSQSQFAPSAPGGGSAAPQD